MKSTSVAGAILGIILLLVLRIALIVIFFKILVFNIIDISTVGFHYDNVGWAVASAYVLLSAATYRADSSK